MFGRYKKGGYRKKRRFGKTSRKTYRSRRNPIRRTGRVKANLRRNFGMGMTRWLGGRTNNRPELKFKDFAADALEIPFIRKVDAGFNGYIAPAVFQISNCVFNQGPGKNQIEGKHINIKNFEIAFALYINPRAMPVIYGNPANYIQLADFNSSATNYNPRVRISIIQQKEGTGVLLTGVDYIPDFGVLGFTAPWDIDRWRVIEDKYYKLAPSVIAQTVQNVAEQPMFGSNDSKFVIYVKKRIPVSQTCEMVAAVGAPGDFYPTVNKRIYVVMTTDAPWFRPAYTAVGPINVPRQPYINVGSMRSRLWYKDP